MTQKQKDLNAVHYLFRSLSGVFFLVMMGVLLSFQAPSVRASEVVDRIVAVVNDEIIVLQDVKDLLASQQQQLQQQIEAAGLSEQEKQRILSEERENLIESLVNQKLIVQAAREYELYNLTVSEAEIDASVASIKEQYKYTDEQFEKALEDQGLTMKQLRTELEEQSLARKLENIEVRSKIVITKDAVTQYYNERTDEYQGKTTYHLRKILINAPTSDSAAEKEGVKSKIDTIFAELAAGTPFDELARKYSDSPYADEGGEVGNIELSDLTPNLQAAIGPLSPGEATQPLETSDGYQILFVQDIHTEPDTPLESVYDDIVNKLYQQRYEEKRKAWIESLRENAHFKIIQ